MRKKTGSVQKRGLNSWRIRYHDLNGIRQYETIKGTREHAERELSKRLGDLAHGIPVSAKPNTVTFEELAADVVNEYIVNKRKSLSDIEMRFRVHLNPVFGHMKAAQITTSQIRSYIRRRLEETPRPANGTVNRELEAMRRAFNLALKERRLMAIPHVPRLEENNVRTGFFTREEVERLAGAFVKLKKPALGAMVQFAFLTGWRLSEIRGLKWSHVDLKRGEIRLDPGTTKNKEGRVFILCAELRALLEKASASAVTSNATVEGVQSMRVKVMAAPTNTHVFRLNGRAIGEFRKTWKAACRLAGLPCVLKPEGKKVRVVKALRTFHDLRRSFAREMDRQGVRQGAVMKLAGWKTDSVYRRYNIVSDADLRDAIDIMDGKTKRAKDGAN